MNIIIIAIIIIIITSITILGFKFLMLNFVFHFIFHYTSNIACVLSYTNGDIDFEPQCLWQILLHIFYHNGTLRRLPIMIERKFSIHIFNIFF